MMPTDIDVHREWSFFVAGVPAPKGSTRAWVAGGRAVVTEANPQTRPWVALVQDAALQEGRPVLARTVPVAVVLEFVLPRPASLPKKVTHHLKKPDLDKLTRAVLDALTGVVWTDDSQVAGVEARKRYPQDGEPTGVTVTIVGGA